MSHAAGSAGAMEAAGSTGAHGETGSLDLSNTVAAVWSLALNPALLPTVASLRRAYPDLAICLQGGSGGEGYADFESLGAEVVAAGDLAAFVAVTSRSGERHVVLITAPVIVPPGFLDRAVHAVDDDLRIATVSFLSNAAGSASVPYRNRPSLHQIMGHDEVSITRRLRSMSPPPLLAPVQAATGDIVLLSRYALGAMGGLDRSRRLWSNQFQTADYSLAASGRGFVNVVDGGTFCTRALDLAPLELGGLDAEESVDFHELANRHPFVVDAHRAAKTSTNSPIGLAVQTAIAKVRGLSIIIDASDLGPMEMGTQVHTLSLVRALANRDDVSQIQLGLPGPIPPYAGKFLQSPKITAVAAPGLDLSEAMPADIIHRPSQPSAAVPFERWRERGSRVVISLQDLIAYQVGAYSATADGWHRYRENLVAGAAGADGIVTISEESRRQVLAEALPLERDRILAVPCGTDHLGGDELDRQPTELLARGFVDQQFLLVIGTNYGHKNRDLAVRAWRMLSHDHPGLALVMAGAHVPAGSSRVLEVMAAAYGTPTSSKSPDLGEWQQQNLYVLPDVSSAERNWLLRHATVVVYPTAAEGFGLVPFEAAVLGTPTVAVGFDPLTELNPNQPVTAASWRVEDLASAIGRLITDPALRDRQVDTTLVNASRLTWDDSAAKLVDFYRSLLSLPARWPNWR